MKIYVVYNSTLHLSVSQSTERPSRYISLCGLTNACDIRDYAKDKGANIYSFADIRNSKIGSNRFDTSVCERCFNHSRGNLNEVPPRFRDKLYPEANFSGAPSSVATDGGEIKEYIKDN